jgi:hypothetical protein
MLLPRILLIIAVIPFALAAPVLVQETRQVGVDDDMPRDVITVLGKRDGFRTVWSGLSHLEDDLGEPADHEPPEEVHEPGVHAPQTQPNPVAAPPRPNVVGGLPHVLVPEGHTPPANVPYLHVVTVLAPPPIRVPPNWAGAYVPPHGRVGDSTVVDGDAPSGSPESGSSPAAESRSNSDH